MINSYSWLYIFYLNYIRYKIDMVFQVQWINLQGWGNSFSFKWQYLHNVAHCTLSYYLNFCWIYKFLRMYITFQKTFLEVYKEVYQKITFSEKIEFWNFRWLPNLILDKVVTVYLDSCSCHTGDCGVDIYYFLIRSKVN